jgi:hypothetical protein
VRTFLCMLALVLVTLFLRSTAAATAAVTPTNHCSFSSVGTRLTGGCGMLFGETPMLTLAPAAGITSGAWKPGQHPVAVWSGDRTYRKYPNAPIELEVYAGGTGILRTQDGWFAVTGVTATSTSLRFDLDASAEVAPNAADRAIVVRAAQVLSSTAVWNRADTRDCLPSATTWSIYCAMVKATIEVTGGFHHRRPALEVVRTIIDKRTAGRAYRHRLMDYNNDPRTTLADVQSLFAEALKRINDHVWLRANGFL